MPGETLLAATGDIVVGAPLPERQQPVDEGIFKVDPRNPGPGGRAIAGTHITLSRVEGGERGTTAQCEINGPRYTCPAIGSHTAHDYRLLLGVRGAIVSEVSIRVPAQDCVITPALHDFVVR